MPDNETAPRVTHLAAVRMSDNGCSVDAVYATTDDGRLWMLSVFRDQPDASAWVQLPPIPQPEPSHV